MYKFLYSLSIALLHKLVYNKGTVKETDSRKAERKITMRALAAIIHSGFGNVQDAVLFCRPDREEDLNPWTSDRLVDWVEVELPDSAEFVNIGTAECPEFVLADFDADGKNPAEPVGYTDRKTLTIYCEGADHHARWVVKRKVNE